MHNALSRLFGISVLLATVMLVTRLSLAPVHGVHSADECARAYAAASSRTDTISADMLSFTDPAHRRVRRRCGELRAP